MDCFQHVSDALSTIYKDLTRSSKHPLGGQVSPSLSVYVHTYICVRMRVRERGADAWIWMYTYTHVSNARM